MRKIVTSISEQIKDTELLMIAQFIDVMEVLDKHEKIEDVCDFDVHLAYKIGLVEGLKIKNKSTK